MHDGTDAETYAAATAAMIREDVERAEDPAIAAADYVADALDANYVVTSRGHVKAVHLVVGTGGPHVEVQHHLGGEGVRVRVWWWQDYAEAYAYAPTLAAELGHLAEAWQDGYVHVGVGR